MPAKKKAKAKPTKPRAAKPAAAAVQELDDGQFVENMFAGCQSSILRVDSEPRQAELMKRFKALRAKFRGLVKSKVTRERAERYAEEVSKLEREAVMPLKALANA
jgi:hypothetical protein